MKTLSEAIEEIDALLARLKADLHPSDYPEALQELSTRVDSALFEWRGEEPDDLDDEEDDDDDNGFDFEE